MQKRRALRISDRKPVKPEKAPKQPKPVKLKGAAARPVQDDRLVLPKGESILVPDFRPSPDMKDPVLLKSHKRKPLTLLAVPVFNELPKYQVIYDGIIVATRHSINGALEVYHSYE
jgi:hypothetical protein